MVIACFSAKAKHYVKKDSLFKKTEKKPDFPNSVFVNSHDTIVYLLDTIKEQRDTSAKSKKLYHDIQHRAYQKKWTKQLYKLLFVDPRKIGKQNKLQKEQSELAFVNHQGKTIRKIEIDVFEPFGSYFPDSTSSQKSRIERMGNAFHHSSRRSHLMRLLRIHEGDRVDAYALADNERMIRQLNYIKDVIFRLVPVVDSDNEVDLQILVKDQFSWGADVDLGSQLSTDVEVYSRNLYGIGHEFSNRIRYDRRNDQKFGYLASYTIRNLRRSLIDASLMYENTHERTVMGINLEKEFKTYSTKSAGGLSFSITKGSDELTEDDPIRNEIPLDFNYGNLWYGRSIQLNSKTMFARRKLFFTARFSGCKFFKRPETAPEVNQFFHNNTLFLLGISMNKTQYYKSNLIYNFGRTEDIPCGFLSQLTLGYEDREYSARSYVALNFQHACFLKKSKTYLFNRFAIGGFLESGRFEQGVLIAQSKFFGRIYKLGALRFRHFADLKYVLGIRRFPEEFILLNNDHGIRGFKTEEVTGNQRLSLNLETIAFTPCTFAGFKFAFYTFGDMGIIGSNKTHIFKGDYYYGLGLGVRVHNENLVFKTMQLRLAFYPQVPSDFHRMEFRISGEERPRFDDFKVGQPEVVSYE